MGIRVLITGDAGFIGSHLSDELLAHGHHVRILDSQVPQVHGPGASRSMWRPRKGPPPYDVVIEAAGTQTALDLAHAIPLAELDRALTLLSIRPDGLLKGAVVP